MPGNNSTLRFGTSISVNMVRVVASNAPLVRNTLPGNARPGYSATAIATVEPMAMSRRYACGTLTWTRNVSVWARSKRALALPPARISAPVSTCRRVIVPANGARTSLKLDSFSNRATAASAAFTSASRAARALVFSSTSCWLTARSLSNRCQRSALLHARREAGGIGNGHGAERDFLSCRHQLALRAQSRNNAERQSGDNDERHTSDDGVTTPSRGFRLRLCQPIRG